MQAGWGLSAHTQYLRIGAERMPGSEGRGGHEPHILHLATCTWWFQHSLAARLLEQAEEALPLAFEAQGSPL